MKKVLMFTGLLILSASTTLKAQSYQHDFQKLIGLTNTSVVNYTLCETSRGGYATAMFEEKDNSNVQNKLQIYILDATYNVQTVQEIKFSFHSPFGMQFIPNDIFETANGGFIIAGKLGVEGVIHQSGGFLIHINKDRKGNLLFDWVQAYPIDPTLSNTPIRSLNGVVEVKGGYIAIGQTTDYPFSKGVIVKTDLNGDVQKIQHVYGDQYVGNDLSVLNDLVSVSENEVAVVGTVNSFTVDDADISLTRVNDKGDIISNWLYELEDFEAGDGVSAYLERGKSIIYDPSAKEFVIAGTITKKVKGVCVHADYNELLTLGVGMEEGNVNWSTRHDIGSGSLFATVDNLFCGDIAMTEKGYAIVGSIENDKLSNVTSDNGYLLRLNNEKLVDEVRFYGLDKEDRLFKVYAKDNNYVTAGTLHKANKNFGWIIESYANIAEQCNQAGGKASSQVYPMERKEAFANAVRGSNILFSAVPTSILCFEDVLCDKVVMRSSRKPIQSGTRINEVDNNDLSVLYPTVVNGDEVILKNNSAFTNYSIHAINGGVVLLEGTLVEGINKINLNEINTGMYLVVCTNTDGKRALFKMIKN